MQPCREFEELIAGGLFGGLSPDDEGRLARHLERCAACAGAYRGLQATLSLTARRAAPDPGRAFWEGYYDRLAERIEGEERDGRVWSDRLAGVRERLASVFLPAPRWAYGLSGGLALVAFGVFLGWLLFEPAPAPVLVEAPAPVAPARPAPSLAAPEDEAPGVAAGAAPAAPSLLLEEEAARAAGLYRSAARPSAPRSLGHAALEQPAPETVSLEGRTTRYLGRSKVLLLGLVNLEPGGEGTLDLSAQQAVARELAREAGALKADLGQADRALLHALVADLELILMQIANLEAGLDVPAIEMVRSGVDRQAILLKINLAEMQQAEAGLQPLGPAPR